MNNKIDDNLSYIRDKKVLIWGLGLQGGGLSSTLFFASQGASVRVTDLKSNQNLSASIQQLSQYPIEYHLERHDISDFEWADIVVVNQDIFHRAPDSPYLQYLIESGKGFETEMGLFFKLCSKPIIGITGTRGKTTTTTALGELLRSTGATVFVGGNIPQSMNLKRIEEANEAKYVVLELSNYQLHGLGWEKISPYISVITSISPDHLISYNTFDEYILDKKQIYKYQSNDDHLVIKRNELYSDEFYQEAASQTHWFDETTLPSDWLLKLPGKHNRENMGSVYTVAKILGIDEEQIRSSITSFSGVAFRLETIAVIDGVSYINDTTATTPTAAIIALNTFPKEKIIWIGGGHTKNLPLDDLVKTINKRVKKCILLDGEGTNEILPLLRVDSKMVELYRDFKQAILEAKNIAQPGDIVLLSPGFSSFGMFVNEFDRGRQFNEIVATLK